MRNTYILKILECSVNLDESRLEPWMQEHWMRHTSLRLLQKRSMKRKAGREENDWETLRNITENEVARLW